MGTGDTILAPGCYDPLGARLIEEAGFPAVYMTGFGTAAGRLGRPDVGLLTLTEMADNARRIASAVGVPVIADADTGYGNALNVIRTVHEFEGAGVAAAVAARQRPEFLIIARTPPVTHAFLRGLGYRLVIFPLSTLLTATAAMRSVLAEIKARGTPIEVLPDMLDFDAFLDLVGIGEIRELEERFADPDKPPRRRGKAVSDVFEKASVSTDLAHRIVAAAEAKATEIGVPMDIAVCDESGVLKAFSRMDGAALLSIQIAQDKAYTAVGFGMPTDGWHEFIKDDPPLAAGAVGGIDRLVIFGGGFPITVGDKVVGAIGVSGGHYTQDMEVAQAGLAVVG